MPGARRPIEITLFLFFIYTDDLYFLLPKRALRGRGEEVALLGLLRRKYGERIETSGLPEAEAPAPSGASTCRRASRPTSVEGLSAVSF
ncbi:MAG TPA: hypothetical protein VF621_17265 [Pyrinomonadaceae bacterium]|jgi:hypothetical protein